jgi:uncharacterized integral membrane protein (TIGR00697 family)
MMNELIFILHSIIIALCSLIALYGGSGALIAYVSIQCILANIMVLKQVTLFGLSATCADPFTIGATLGLNLLQEYYGRAITKKTIAINFGLLVFYLIMSQIHLWYIPNTADTMHPHFVTLFSFMPRLIIASFSVFLISQSVDYWLYGILQRSRLSRFLVLRNYGSILVSQLIDTVLFSLFGLYGLVDSIVHIIVISYAVKVLAIIITVPFIALSKRIAIPDAR